MAETYVYYNVEMTDGSEFHMCYLCALKCALDTISSDNVKRVSIKSTNYNFTVCNQCKEFIEDKVEI